MSDLTQAIFNVINYPEEIPNNLVDDLVTVLEAARLVADPNYEAAAMALVRLLHEVPEDEIEDDWLYDMDEDTKVGWLEWAKKTVDAALTGDTE